MLTMATTGATAAAARAATTFGTFSHRNDDKSDNHNKNSTNDKSCHIENPFYQVTDDGERNQSLNLLTPYSLLSCCESEWILCPDILCGRRDTHTRQVQRWR